MSKENLYKDLMNLVENSAKDEFYFDDRTLDDKVYRIFNYRLVSWQTFQENKNAKWARGIMFDITDAENPILVSRPMAKFFNYAEGGVNHSSSVIHLSAIQEKLDGSLISTYMHNGELRLKSKGSLESNQARAAMKFLNKPENNYLREFLLKYEEDGYTINLEWTSPNNRIVIGYDEDELRILNGIKREDGRLRLVYWKHATRGLPLVAERFDMLNAFYEAQRETKLTLDEYVEELYKEEEGEGYVLTLFDFENGSYQVKVKNFKYCNLHKLKDSINTPTALAELVIRGQTDDLVEAFTHDQTALDLIKEMEDLIIPVFNAIVRQVEDFYKLYHELDRKSYAIKAKESFAKEMSLAMNLYIGRANNYEEFAIKNMKELFGVSNDDKQ